MTTASSSGPTEEDLQEALAYIRPLLKGHSDDLTIASINNDYAEKAGLSLNKDAVIKESPKSPYANLIAVRCDNASRRRISDRSPAPETSPARSARNRCAPP